MTEVWNPADLPFPQRYGPDDTLGAANEITPETVRAAAGLIREGRRYGLAQVLDESSPVQMWRYWKHALLTDGAMPGREQGANRLAFLEEAVSGAMHSGTHLDGLAHIGIAGHTYNGHRYADVVGATGVDRLGIESVPPIVTRGVLLDVAGLEGRDVLGPTEAITDEHLAAAAARHGVEVGAGDVVLVHTGWGALWGVDAAAYAAGEPGIGLSAARWCTDRRVAVIGADNWAVEVVGAERDDLVFPVHQHCIAQYGCYLLENVRTDQLVRDRVHEFFCAILPARLRGATASIVQPVAIV